MIVRLDNNDVMYVEPDLKVKTSNMPLRVTMG